MLHKVLSISLVILLANTEGPKGLDVNDVLLVTRLPISVLFRLILQDE